jgi:hypothetical protein
MRSAAIDDLALVNIVKWLPDGTTLIVPGS